MIGQDKIQQRLDMYNYTTFPQSNLIVGEVGSGKHTFIKEVCDKLGLPCIDISTNIDREYLDGVYLSVERKVYVIDIIEISKNHRYINKENALLKFIEEPPITSIIFVIAEYESQVLDTIKNRCVLWKLSPYNIEILKQFKQFDNSRIYTLLNTPGKLLDSEEPSYYEELFDICANIVNNISRANVSNTLSLSKYLTFTGGSYEFTLLLGCIKLVLYEQYVTTYDDRHDAGLRLVSDYIDRSHVLNVNEKNLFSSFILKLKDIYD